MHIAPEIVHIFGIPIYNTLFTTFVTDAVLLLMVFAVYKNLKPVPGKLQSIFEQLVSYFYNLTEQISGKRADVIFPWVASFFLFILVSNLLGLLPGFGTIGEVQHTSAVHASTDSTEHTSTDTHTQQATTTSDDTHKDEEEAHGTRIIPLLRPATSDFNTTLALSVISLVATHTIAIRSTGLKDYLSRFFALNPIYLFVGILELVSEVTKLFSLSFRLFGNIFAGEVVLHTIAELSAFLAPIPFLLLESIVALVQALVFAMLTMVFMSILSTPHHGEEH